MPLFLGLVCAITLHVSITYKKLYVAALPVLLFGIGVNARIGFVPVIVYLVLMPLVLFGTNKRLDLLIVSGIVLIAGLSIAQVDVNSLNGFDFYPTVKWLHEGYLEVTGEKTVTTLGILQTKIHFPPPSQWILGTGVNIFLQSRANFSSDIGYVLQFYYGGVVYLVSVAAPLLILLISAIARLRDFPTRVLFASFIISVLIANYKGDFFTNNEALKGLIICSFVMIGLSNKTSVHKTNISSSPLPLGARNGEMSSHSAQKWRVIGLKDQ